MSSPWPVSWAPRGNSSPRRAVKRLAAPLLGERAYSWLQALSIARDIRSGAFTEPEMALVAPAVRRGESVIDVGANLGMYLREMSRAVGPQGVVYAFEPIPFTCMTLRKIVGLGRLHNVRISATGCADRAGTATFQVPLQAAGALSTGQAHLGIRDDAHPGRAEQVRWTEAAAVAADVVMLDDVIPGGREVSLIKCDVEGAELLALRGAAQIIRRDQPTVICEINPWFLEGFGIGLGDLLGFFADQGYGCYRYDGARLTPVVSDDQIVEDNYVFVHPRRRSRLSGLLLGAPVTGVESAVE